MVSQQTLLSWEMLQSKARFQESHQFCQGFLVVFMGFKVHCFSGLLRIFTLFTMCFPFILESWVICWALGLDHYLALSCKHGQYFVASWVLTKPHHKDIQAGGSSLQTCLRPCCLSSLIWVFFVYVNLAAHFLSSSSVLSSAWFRCPLVMKEHLLSWATCWWVNACVFPCLIGWSPASLDWL